MPLYEYECESCGHRFEVIQKFSDAPIAACPQCAGPVHKLLSSPAIQFKGSGFYLTDYGRGTGSKSDGSANTKAGKNDSGGSAGDAAKGDAAKSKSDTTPASSTSSDSKPSTKAD